MINKILKHSVFKNKPPVLVDLGASGEKKEDWKKLLNHSVTILVDGDSRDFNVDEIGKDKEIKTYKINNIISNSSGLKTFYLTRYPHCSSLLKPNTEILKDWAFKEKFDVIKIQKKKQLILINYLKKQNLIT